MNDKRFNGTLKEWGGTRHTLGPNSSIHNIRVLPKGEDVMASTKVRCVPVGNIAYEPLVEGNTYLVYRKNEQTGEPTYSLCVYSNGNWIPAGLEPYIKNIPYFTGIPVTEDDYWVCANTAFADGTVCETTIEPPVEPESPEEDKHELSVKEFIDYRLVEMAVEEQEAKKKAEQEKFEQSKHSVIPKAMPITLSPEQLQIRDLRKLVNVLIEYIEKRDNELLTEPVVEQNWEHLKKFTNELCDRICELERKVAILQLTLTPAQPIQPWSPNTPYVPNQPSVPDWPYWPPYGPIISYSLPGGSTYATNKIEKKS